MDNELFDEEMVDHVLTEEDFVHHAEDLKDSGLVVGDVIEISKDDIAKFTYEKKSEEPAKDENGQAGIPVKAEEGEQVDEAGDLLPEWARTPETRATIAEANNLLQKEQPKPVSRLPEEAKEWEQA